MPDYEQIGKQIQELRATLKGQGTEMNRVRLPFATVGTLEGPSVDRGGDEGDHPHDGEAHAGPIRNFVSVGAIPFP